MGGHLPLLPVPGGPLPHHGAHDPLFPGWWTVVCCGQIVAFVFMLEVGLTCLLLSSVSDMLMTLDREVCPNTKLELSSLTLETHHSLSISTQYLDHLEIFNKL